MTDYTKLPLAEGEARTSVFQENTQYSPVAESARAFGQA